MNLLLDFMILNIFLGLGWIVREKFPVLQRIFMPSSVIGGILLLICGPQLLNIVPISPMIGRYPNFLIIIILTCLVFGSRLDSSRMRSYMDYTLLGLELCFPKSGRQCRLIGELQQFIPFTQDIEPLAVLQQSSRRRAGQTSWESRWS